MKIKLILNGFIIFLFIVAAGGESFSQTLIATLKAEANRLDRLTGTAQEVLATFDNSQARGFLEKALSLRRDAERNISNQEYEKALAHVRLAIEFVQKAIELALKNPVQRLRNQLEELMRRAEHEVIGNGNREAERLIQEAKKNQRLANQAFEKRDLKAVEYYRVAISIVERAMRLRSSIPNRPVEIYERAKEHFIELNSQARDAVANCQAPGARRVLEQGEKQSRSAEDAFHRKEFVLAQKLYNDATRLVMRAIDLCRSRSHVKDQIKNELRLLNDLILQTEERISNGQDIRSQKLLLQARRLAKRSEGIIANGRYKRARQFINQSRMLISQTDHTKIPDTENFRSQCEITLQKLNNDLNETSRQAENTNNTDVKRLLELVRNTSVEAEKICRNNQGSFRLAARFRMVARIGHQLLFKAEALLQNSTKPSFDRMMLRNRLEQLDATIQEVQVNISDTPNRFTNVLVERAITMRERAWKAYNRKHYVIAFETSTIASGLLREALKLAN